MLRSPGGPTAGAAERTGQRPLGAAGGGVLLGGAAVMELIGGLIPEKEENKEERP